MNTLTVSEQREAEKERGLNVAFLLFSLVTLCAIFLGCAFLYGKYEGRQEAKAEYDAAPKLVRMVVQPALQQWNCSKQEFKEHIQACAKRERMGAITAKE